MRRKVGNRSDDCILYGRGRLGEALLSQFTDVFAIRYYKTTSIDGAKSKLVNIRPILPQIGLGTRERSR
jgi:hypothetical protein